MEEICLGKLVQNKQLRENMWNLVGKETSKGWEKSY